MTIQQQAITTSLPVNQILRGHVIEQLQKLADKCVNCIVTSPPYWSLRNYFTKPVVWDGYKRCKHIWIPRNFKLHNGRGDAQKSAKYSKQAAVADTKLKDAICIKCQAWKGELGLEPDFRMYVKHLADIFDECKRVLSDDGSLWIVMGDTYNGSGGAGGDYNKGGIKEGQPTYKQAKQRDLPQKTLLMIPERLAIELVDRGWVLRNKIIWKKNNCMPSSARDRFTVDWEYVLFFTKNEKYYFNTQYEPYADSTVKQIQKANAKSKLGANTGVNNKLPYQQNNPHRMRLQRQGGYDRMPPIGGIKRAGGQASTYSGNQPAWRKQFPASMGGGGSSFQGHSGYLKADGTLISNSVFGRIQRACWTINTTAFGEKHYAVYPEKLIATPLMAACPQYVCSKCSKPALNQYKEFRENTRPGNDVGNKKSGNSGDPNEAFHKSDWSKYRQQVYRVADGMQTSCNCKADMKPGIVLDPFIGTGTTAIVALKQGKSFIGIELNTDYIKLANKRIKQFLAKKAEISA